MSKICESKLCALLNRFHCVANPVLHGQVVHFDYNLFSGKISRGKVNDLRQSEFRVKDWGSAPRWVAFVDFFLASLAKHAVVSGAQRRVGTTYAQLIATLAAAHQLGMLTPFSAAALL